MRLRTIALTATILSVRATAGYAQEEPPEEDDGLVDDDGVTVDDPGGTVADDGAAGEAAEAEAEPPVTVPGESVDLLEEEPPPRSISPGPSSGPELGISREARPFRPPSEIRFPFVFNSPTARLLPGAVVYSSSGIDTGRGLSSQVEVGLGDVAEFGVAVTDLIRAQDGDAPGAEAEGLFPYFLAHFKMGLGENRMFRHQPALALGFRKSFERSVDDHTSRVAELYFVASKDFGSRLTLHAGGSFWDASLSNGMNEVTLHGTGGALANQLRAFGGIELRPFNDAEIMLEVFWLPQFTYRDEGPETIDLHAQLAWGVRYQLLRWAVVEAGVRIPEIDNVDLLDAQIFGQFKIVSRKLRETLRLE